MPSMARTGIVLSMSRINSCGIVEPEEQLLWEPDVVGDVSTRVLVTVITAGLSEHAVQGSNIHVSRVTNLVLCIDTTYIRLLLLVQ